MAAGVVLPQMSCDPPKRRRRWANNPHSRDIAANDFALSLKTDGRCLVSCDRGWRDPDPDFESLMAVEMKVGPPHPQNSVPALHGLGGGIIRTPPKSSATVMKDIILRLIEDLNSDSRLTEQNRINLRHLHEQAALRLRERNTLLSRDGLEIWDGVLAKIGEQPGQFDVARDLFRSCYARREVFLQTPTTCVRRKLYIRLQPKLFPKT